MLPYDTEEFIKNTSDIHMKKKTRRERSASAAYLIILTSHNPEAGCK
jgi:hypothetical protein